MQGVDLPGPIFKHKDLVRENREGDIDWWLYREKVLYPLLYAFCENIEVTGKKVWLVEENAGAHGRASDICEEARKRRGIHKVPWPPNSPHLNSVEDCWGYIKDMLEEYAIQRCSVEAKQAKEATYWEWYHRLTRGYMHD